MSDPYRQESTTKVPAKDVDDKNKDKEDKKEDIKEEKKEADKAAQVDAVKAPKNEEELSPEDVALKERLSLYVERIKDENNEIAKQALISLKEEIRSATSSMTSIPKPLKFLKEHYQNIKIFYENIKDVDKKKTFADLMSILAMVYEEPETRKCLKYRLEGELIDIEPWGSQYVKHLVAEIRKEMEARVEASQDEVKLAKLIPLVQILKVGETIVKYYMQHNAEPDACDLLLETEKLDVIKDFCEKHNHLRVGEYLRACAAYQPYPEDITIYNICFDIYYHFKSWYHALRFALKLDNPNLVKRVMKQVKRDKLLSRQLAYLLGWHQFGYDPDEQDDDGENENKDDENENENENIEEKEEREEGTEDDTLPSIRDIIANDKLSEAFHNLARDLDVLDPKDPETDIFKEQLLDNAPQVISARKSLAITYVNAFVNAAFGTDKYMNTGKIADANAWIAKNKEKGQMAAVASIGTILLWDEDAQNKINRYFESEHNSIRAGAYLAIGLSCAGRRSEEEVAKALLPNPAQNLTDDNKKSNKTLLERKAASFGLGMAYAGTADEEIYQTLATNINVDEDEELSSLSALALGLVFVGTCNEEISNLIITDLMERMEKDANKLNNNNYLFNALALGLLFLGKSEEVETTSEATQAFNELNPKYANTLRTTLEVLAYAGTGNVLKVQTFLSIIAEHYEDEEPKDEKKDENENPESNAANINNPFAAFGGGAAGNIGGTGGTKNSDNEDDNEEEEKKIKEDYRYYQSIAVLGIALCCMGEEIGIDMSLRMFNHFIQYGNVRVKRATPLALALLHVSNPKMEVSDILSKLTHDHDNDISQNAILGLGIIGAGTNNARIASMLRALNIYYSKDADHLFCIRIAEGFVHMGKGLLTIQPYHSDRFLLSKVALGGILTLLFACIDIKDTILGSKHWLLYSVLLAMKPRMLITLDEQLKPIKLSVRVGQALDVVGQAGKPKSITGFQTHETPVLLGYKDRAEFATEDYISYTPILEGFAIVKVNPEAEKLKKKKDKTERQNK